MTVALVALSIAAAILAGGVVTLAVYAIKLGNARLADQATVHQATTERNDALAAKGTAVARAEAAEKLALAGQHGTAKAAAKEIRDVKAAPTAGDVIDLARGHAGLPPLSGGGVSDVPGAATPEADPAAGPDAVRGPDDAA